MGSRLGYDMSRGSLVSAATRGNGLEGEDVTANVKTIESIRIICTGRMAGGTGSAR